MNDTLAHVFGYEPERSIRSDNLRTVAALPSPMEPWLIDSTKVLLIEDAKRLAGDLTLDEAAELAAVLTEIIMEGCKK